MHLHPLPSSRERAALRTRLGRMALSLSLVAVAALFAGTATAAAATGATDDRALVVGATSGLHTKILEVAKPLLAEEGIELDIRTFNDYVLPNLALADGDLDANSFQHIPYLQSFSRDHDLDLTYTAKTLIAPMGIYSREVERIEDIPDGAIIGIPNDPTNGGRALLLLQSLGLIELREDAGLEATEFDVAENPKSLQILPLEAPYLPRSLNDVTAAAINTNYAVEAGMIPARDSIAREGPDSPYVNVVAVRAGDEHRPGIQALGSALNSPEVRKFIETEYAGAVVPAF